MGHGGPLGRAESNFHSAYGHIGIPTWSDGQHSAERALYAEGIGHIDQYGSYLETLWSKGVVYFLRDYLFHDIDEPGSRGRSPTISGRRARRSAASAVSRSRLPFHPSDQI